MNKLICGKKLVKIYLTIHLIEYHFKEEFIKFGGHKKLNN